MLHMDEVCRCWCQPIYRPFMRRISTPQYGVCVSAQVVADPKIRQALLQGPLVSFETVVPEPKARAGPVTVLDEDAALRDRTFNLTSVPGVVEEGVEVRKCAPGGGVEDARAGERCWVRSMGLLELRTRVCQS